jgi:outer membrane protein insertion porin family
MAKNRTNAGAKTKFGMIGSLNDDIRIGYNDLFQVGGVYYDGVVRGYGESELGTDLLMMTLSAELRFPIIDQQFYMGGFFDMGNSWNKLGDVNIADMYKGVGVGFRLMLPMVGLLGFDFGWPLDFPNKNPLDLNYSHTAKPKFYFIMNKGF